MNLVSVQGFAAKNLAIREERIKAFESAINAITGKSILFIPSPYRSDILYPGKRDYSGEIIHLWLLYANAEDSLDIRRNFFTTNTKKDTLEAFFVRLVYLSSNRYWFNRYVKILRQKLSESPGNPMSIELHKCQQFIKNDGIHRMFEFNTAENTVPVVSPGLSSDISRSCLRGFVQN